METTELVTVEPVVNVALLYNAFDTTDVVREELLYEEDKSLAEYIEGLPASCEWKVGLNGVPVDEADFTAIAPKPNDLISIVAVPRGGAAKDILRLVAQVVVTVVAMAVGFAIGGPLGAMAAAGIMLAGNFLVNAILPPSMPKMKDMETDGNSYGYDGAKNTAREGVALPVCYGEFQTGGNYVDVFTENVGANQFLYGRVVLSDGEIEGLTAEPEINETPISDYKDVEYGHTKGSLTEAINARFGKTKSHFQRQDKLDTTWTEYTTSGQVDAFEINFLFPRGLIEYDQEDGDKKSESMDIEIQYAPFGSSTFTGTGTTADATTGYTTFTGSSPTATKFNINVKGTGTPTVSDDSVTYKLQYKLSSSGTWIDYQTYTDTASGTTTTSTWSDGDPFVKAMLNQMADDYTYTSSFPTRSIYLTLASGTYDFRIINIDGTSSIVKMGYQSAVVAGSTGTTIVTYTETSAAAVRKTYKSPSLTHGRYHIRFRRVEAEQTEPNKIDECHCTDVAEVLHTNVALRSVATGWFVAKMTDQLQGVPNITWKVKGVKVPIYNVNGVITSTVWSNNPADIVLDMLISDRRGPLKDKIQIDWPAFVEWRDYCNEEELTFNGIFDSTTTLWDAVIQVFRVGRAMPVRIGARLSVAVDKPRQPVMLFGPGNIYQDTFEIGYLPLQDRAAEFEVSFYDKADRNKKKTIRIADPTAAQAGQVPKTVAYELFGVDNFTQAQKEVWYQLYNNRLQRRIVSFDAPVEAIGLTIGDVALIQHDMVEWGQAGRLAGASSTTQVTLDKTVTIESGSTYSLLCIHSQVSRFTCNISFVTGTTYALSGISNTSHAEELLKRLKTNTNKEATILAFNYTGGTNATVTLDRTVTGTTATVWDVDVIEERTVTVGVGDHTVITVAAPFSQVPAQYTNYMFGVQSNVKRPFKLNSINGNDIYRRSLSFVEYNDLVWSPPETIIPPPTVQPPKHPEHVLGLMLAVEPYRSGTTVNGTLSWLSGHIKRYAGADIYISIDDSEYMFYQSVMNTTQVMIPFQTGTYIKLKVVAFNDTSLRANVNTAPEIIQTIVSAASTLANPQGLGWTLQQVDYMARGYLSWALPTSTTLPVSPYTRVQIKYQGQTEWIDRGTTSETTLELNDIPAGGHIARIRAENTTGAISNWVNLEFDIDIPVLVSPTFVTSGSAVDHDVNTDGSVNLSLEWLWSGNENDIEGFEVISYQGGAGSEYFLGSQPGQETTDVIAVNKRIHWYYGVPADKFYTMYVRAYRSIHPSFSANGKLYSNAVKPSLGSENPYQPNSSVAFGGDVTGSVGGIPVDEILAAIGATDSTPPAIPTGLSLSSTLEPGADGDEWIKLNASWSPNADGDMLGYVLAIKEGTGNFIEFSVGESATAFYWSVLPATSYTVKILAFDKYNNRSGFSGTVSHTTVSDTTAPSTPTSVLATGSFKNIYLTWNNPNNADLAYVEIYEKTVNVTPTYYANTALGADASLIVTKQAKANTKGFFSREGPSGTRYYWVAAIDTSGNRSAFSTVTSATPGTQIIEAEIADFALTIAKFGDTLNPIERVAALPSTGNYYGRLVMLSTDNKVYRWVGAGTKAAPVTGTASWSSAADAGDLTTGTLNANRIAAGSISADKIAANSITASKLALGDWVNLCHNGQFANNLSWTLDTGYSISQDATVAYQGRSWVMKVAANAGANRRTSNENKFPATAGESFNVSWWVRTTAATLTGAVLVEIQWYNAANTLLSAGNVGTMTTQNTTYTQRTGNVTAPANTAYGIVTVLANNTAGEVDIGEIYVARRNAGQLIVDGTITTNMISAGGIAADVITTGTMSAARLAAGTTISGSVIVGSYTFDELENLAELGGQDPAIRINTNATLIQPGKVLISGATTLSDWRNGTDTTKIEGGSIAANTVSANKLTIGVRGVDISGLSFQANSPSTNRVSWTAGDIIYTDDAGAIQTVSITANSVLWSSGTLYLYWTKGGTSVLSTGATATAYAGNNVVLATYRGGVDLVVTYGRTIIDGSHIATDTIDANKIKAGTVLASTVLIGTVTAGQISQWAWDADATYIDGGNIFTNTITASKLSVTSLSAITATIGTLRTATTGARTEIKDNLITVYDASNVMRVRMGIWTV